MGVVDPSYPLLPTAYILSSVMLSLVLMTSFVRERWNLGVAFLCFWLLVENISNAASVIIWSDNADLKLYVFCDIVTHIQEIAFVVRPMATLIITRRLYLIARLQSVELPSKAARRRDLAIEWTLGLGAPLFVASPIYYANQGARFEITEGFGCTTGNDTSILALLIEESWSIIPPLISITFYYPKVAKLYYHQRKDINNFLRSNASVSRTNYMRILVLASIDLWLTLPIGIVKIVLEVTYALSPPKYFPFYPGWHHLHSEWGPVSVTYAEQQSDGTADLAQSYFSHWSTNIIAFAIFGLFGLTSEARASYWRIVCTIGGWFGWKPTPSAQNGRGPLGEIEFGVRPQDSISTSDFDLEMGSRPPSFVNADAAAAKREIEDAMGGRSVRASTTDSQSTKEDHCNELVGDAYMQAANHRDTSTSGDEQLDVLESGNVAIVRSVQLIQSQSASWDADVRTVHEADTRGSLGGGQPQTQVA
ncbi:unnamed protein product [Peniophora sp. CBMAI 1063]|nr:unnamed protein product [Peniophora sp. CBMAI 1063]